LDGDNGSVEIINVTTGDVTGTISFNGDYPQQVAISPNGKRAYVAQFNGGVSVIKVR
jgi:hypothetical protein